MKNVDIYQIIAKLLFLFRVKPRISSGIDGELTFGYGKLDDNGYWQFQLPRGYFYQNRGD